MSAVVSVTYMFSRTTFREPNESRNGFVMFLTFLTRVKLSHLTESADAFTDLRFLHSFLRR
jgi:hypothetical protein